MRMRENAVECSMVQYGVSIAIVETAGTLLREKNLPASRVASGLEALNREKNS